MQPLEVFYEKRYSLKFRSVSFIKVTGLSKFLRTSFLRNICEQQDNVKFAWSNSWCSYLYGQYICNIILHELILAFYRLHRLSLWTYGLIIVCIHDKEKMFRKKSANLWNYSGRNYAWFISVVIHHLEYGRISLYPEFWKFLKQKTIQIIFDKTFF